MRVIHLCFQLHEPFALQKLADGGENPDYFASKAAFTKVNAEIYQPLFALLERNTQKFREFRFSLVVSGPWLELAERYDNALIERLCRLVKLGQVELIAEPYYHSLAFFYDKDELMEQVRLYREKIQKLFGVEGRIFALPELIYNDQVGKWAEDYGFAGMLVGGSPRVLGWHSPNHVYEAMECRYLRLLFRNTPLSQALADGDKELLAEKRSSDETETVKMVLSAQKFQKRLELDMLRGNLVNLYLDAEVLRTRRGDGIIGFFDELIAMWLDTQGNHFVGAAQACVVETPKLALSVRESVSWRVDTEQTEESMDADALVLASEIETQPPRWLSKPRQVELAKAVYGLKREILASEDAKLIADWRRLTAVDYQAETRKSELENLQLVLDDLHKRAETVKKAQAVEISRAYTKKHDRGNIDVRPTPQKVQDNIIKVNFGQRAAGTASHAVHAVAKQAETEIPVQRLHQCSVEIVPEVPVEVAEAEIEVSKASKVEPPKVQSKPRGIRKVIRKLVIE